MTKIKVFYLNDIRECCYIIYDDSKECAIVDPGMQTDNECGRIEKFITENQLKPVMLLCTHGHFDHVMGNAFVSKRWNIPTYINPNDKQLLMDAGNYFKSFGYDLEQPPIETIDLHDGDEIKFGETILKVITTPGHTKGSVCFYCEKGNFILTGDTLFAGSIGRTDLPGGDYDQLMESLLDKVIKVNKEARVLPGHGPESTIIVELQNNPFLRYE